MKRLDRAIRDMREAREIHQSWADSIAASKAYDDAGDFETPCETCGRSPASVGGNEAEHRQWVRNYDRVLALLAELKDRT